MAWATFDDRRAAWHRASLAIAFTSYLLLLAGAVIVLVSVALAVWQGRTAMSLAVGLAGGVLIAAVGWIGNSRSVIVKLRRYALSSSGPHLEYPETEQQVIDLVRRALAEKLRVRVHGSDHSVIASIAEEGEHGCLHISLERMNRIVEWDEPNLRVRVQAGCVLGVDPARPSSTADNSLLHQFDRRGWGLPLLGGVTHQSVGGFMMTGSSGGSTAHSLSESIVGIRLVDGTGTPRDLAPNPDDPQDQDHNAFYAAGVSLGLLGIVTEVTFQCEPRFDIGGQEATTSVAAAEIDLLADGEKGLTAALRRMEYSRVMWWPQRGVECMQVWHARRLRPDEIPTPRKPYVQIPGGRPAQTVLGLYFQWANASARRSPWRSTWMTRITNALLTMGTVRFDGAWFRTIPMDNEIDNDLMPAAFSELWIDLDRSHEVGAVLAQFYAGDVGHERAGSFAVELYAAKRNRFWLSPGYGHDTIRVDLMHVEQGAIRPESEYFPQFWPLLARFDPRYHWGKLMPPSGPMAGYDYFARVYPKWDDFMRVRSEFDPHQVFVTAYWREKLGLSAASLTASAS